MRKITCCKDCINRYPGCHSTCQEYITQKSEAIYSHKLTPVDLYIADYNRVLRVKRDKYNKKRKRGKAIS